MALAADALISLAALKEARTFVGTGSDAALERAIEKASAIIRDYVGWPVVGLSGITEYHTPQRCSHELLLLDRPIVSIASVHEDPMCQYGADTLLEAGSDYIVSMPSGRLLRVSDGLTVPWAGGWRSVKVVGSYGYLNQASPQVPSGAAAVPPDIQDACIWVASRIFGEDERRQFDVSSVTDATGTVTRFSSSRLPPMMRERLTNYRRWNLAPTGERDA